MQAIELSTWEERQLGLLLASHGADRCAFTFRKFQQAGAARWQIRVRCSTAATLYEGAGESDWVAQFTNDLRAGVFGERRAGLPPVVETGLERVRGELSSGGLRSALRILNERVPHRMTAVYRAGEGVMENLAVVDKHPEREPVDLSVVPLELSFCQYVMRDGLFVTQDSAGDARLGTHPYRGVMGCYVGVPIQRDGQVLGSLCHFDFESHALADEEFLLLDRVARLLPSLLALDGAPFNPR